MVKQVWAAALLLAACAQPQSLPVTALTTLTQLWSTPGFSNPESILPSADGAFFYVTNVAGEGDARDGNGFIARMTPDGTIVTRDWAKGLDAPKGMALRDGRLYVSDIDDLVVLDAASGAEMTRHVVPGAKFLNDVALAPDGAVLVADSGSARIFALKDGAVTEWRADAAFDSINGLLPEPGRLVVTTMAGKLLAVDWTTKAITTLASDLGQADGVAPLGGGAYLVSEWPGRLFEVGADGGARVLLDTREAKTLLNDFVLVGDTLYVPNWGPGSVTAYRVAR